MESLDNLYPSVKLDFENGNFPMGSAIGSYLWHFGAYLASVFVSDQRLSVFGEFVPTKENRLSPTSHFRPSLRRNRPSHTLFNVF